MIQGKQLEAVFMGTKQCCSISGQDELGRRSVFGGNNIIFGDEVNSDAREDAILGKGFLMSVY
jgi:hypothetical protein